MQHGKVLSKGVSDMGMLKGLKDQGPVNATIKNLDQRCNPSRNAKGVEIVNKGLSEAHWKLLKKPNEP